MIFSEIKDQIPDNVLYFFKGLQNECRFTIFTLLQQYESLSLSKLMMKTNSKSGYLLKHLNTLEQFGIVDNYIEKKEGTREYSFYTINEFSLSLYEKIEESLGNYNLNENSDLLQIYPNIFKSLANRLRFFIILLLKDEKELDFTNLLQKTESKKSSLSYHLSKLEETHIIQNFLQKNKDSNKYSYYKLTNIGTGLIQTILDSLIQFYSPSPTR